MRRRRDGTPVPARHIVAIPSWYSGGRGSGGGYFRDQALALQAAGHRIAILAPDIHTYRDLRAGRVSRAEGGRVIVEHDGIDVWRRTRRVVMPRLPYRNALSWSYCGLALFAAYVERRGMPDLVHAHCCLNAGALAALIRARHGVPFVLTEHSTGFAEGRLRWWERDLVRRVISRAAACAAVSPHLAALLERQFPGRSWAYVPNVLGPEFLDPPQARRRRRETEGFVFLCAARMSPVKNHALLIEAFADAFADSPDVMLRLAGSGPLQPALKLLCTTRGIAKQVAFLGTLPGDELRTEMENADAFALASDVETFGLVVIEAQAAGLPVVVTASGGPDHLVGPENGVLIPAGNRTALRDALITMRRRAGQYDRSEIAAGAIRRFGPEGFSRRFAEIAP
jgi:glycosyltransferase involved in cell wall biosynthesis